MLPLTALTRRVTIQRFGKRALSSSTSSQNAAVTYETDALGRCWITMNAPKSRNALSSAMMAELTDSFVRAQGDGNIKLVVLRALGPAFSGGHDLKELRACQQAGDSARMAAIFDACSRMMLALGDVPVPTIAAVNNKIAAAAGAQLVASCDMLYAAQSSRFSTPGITIGLFCSTPGVAMARNLPPKIASEALFTGRDYSADEMHRAGLVTRVFSDDTFDKDLDAVTAGIATKPAAILKLGKKALRSQVIQRDLAMAYITAEAAMCANLLDPDCAEGIASFLEKRHPSWAPAGRH